MTLVMVAVVATAAALVTVVAGAGALGTEASRAQGAADACALAAAAEARDLRALGGDRVAFHDESCALAREVAKEWRFSLASCSVHSDGSVDVTIETRAWGVSVRRSSRAGTG